MLMRTCTLKKQTNKQTNTEENLDQKQLKNFFIFIFLINELKPSHLDTDIVTLLPLIL